MFYRYDCERFQLCPGPKLAGGGACRPMADPALVVRGAVGLGRLAPGQTPPSLSAAAATTAVTATTAATTTAAVAAGMADAGVGPRDAQPVLLLGEGAATSALSRLFLDSNSHMLWREPRTWRAVSHLPDELYAETVATSPVPPL